MIDRKINHLEGVSLEPNLPALDQLIQLKLNILFSQHSGLIHNDVEKITIAVGMSEYPETTNHVLNKFFFLDKERNAWSKNDLSGTPKNQSELK